MKKLFPYTHVVSIDALFKDKVYQWRKGKFVISSEAKSNLEKSIKKCNDRKQIR